MLLGDRLDLAGIASDQDRIVDHGAQTFSLYGQLGDIQVQRGASVERGQAIGSVGNVPAGIPGIYFEMRIDGKPVDPLEWLGQRP